MTENYLNIENRIPPKEFYLELDNAIEHHINVKKSFAKAISIVQKCGFTDFEISMLLSHYLKNKIPETTLRHYLAELIPKLQIENSSIVNPPLEENDDNNSLEHNGQDESAENIENEFETEDEPEFASDTKPKNIQIKNKPRTKEEIISENIALTKQIQEFDKTNTGKTNKELKDRISYLEKFNQANSNVAGMWLKQLDVYRQDFKDKYATKFSKLIAENRNLRKENETLKYFSRILEQINEKPEISDGMIVNTVKEIADRWAREKLEKKSELSTDELNNAIYDMEQQSVTLR